MQAVKMMKKNLPDFIQAIELYGTLWGPVRDGNQSVLGEIKHHTDLDMTSVRTTLPIKKLLLPPEFPMFSFDDGKAEACPTSVMDTVVFGLHPCDIHGLRHLDHFFSSHYQDPYYLERRKKTVIIGLSCMPDEKCFCKTTNTHHAESGFDLFLTDLGEFYLIWVGSRPGDNILRDCSGLLEKKLTSADMDKYVQWRRMRDQSFSLDLDFSGMPSIMELCWDHPMWEELGSCCLSCGVCTIVCPTCPCFNVRDDMFPGQNRGFRIRQWDSCTFNNYSLVAGGHNFRQSRSERLKLRFTHKLQAFVGKFGEPACVGCGRCIDTCPTGIDIRSVSLRLRGEEVSS